MFRPPKQAHTYASNRKRRQIDNWKSTQWIACTPTKVFRRLTASVNETIVKPRVAAATNTYTSDFPDV